MHYSLIDTYAVCVQHYEPLGNVHVRAGKLKYAHMHAVLLDIAFCVSVSQIVDFICTPCAGSGYLTGCLGIMVGETGQVLGVEKHKELAERSMTSLTNAVPELMRSGTVKIMPGNVLGKVLKEYGPFDAIHVGAAAATMPQVGYRSENFMSCKCMC